MLSAWKCLLPLPLLVFLTVAIATKYLFSVCTKVLSVILLKVSGVIHLIFSHGSHQVPNLFQIYALMLFFFDSSSQTLVPKSNWQGLLVFCTSSYIVCFPKSLYSFSWHKIISWPLKQHQEQMTWWQQLVWHQERQHQEPWQEQRTLLVAVPSLCHKANLLLAVLCEGGSSGLINSVSISLHGSSYLKKGKRMKAIFFPALLQNVWELLCRFLFLNGSHAVLYTDQPQ